jgi:hypothetical protein
MEPQIISPTITPIEGVSTYVPQGIRVRGVENPQGFGIDERRFVDRNFQQNSTRMTQIKRIFTDPCESASSAQSVLYRTDSRTKSTAKV